MREWFRTHAWAQGAAGAIVALAAAWLVYTAVQDHRNLNQVVTFLNQAITAQQKAQAAPALPTGK